MFIQNGNRRINLDLAKEYKPTEHSFSGGINYKIEIIYESGEKEEICFFTNLEKRDSIIKYLDKKNLME